MIHKIIWAFYGIILLCIIVFLFEEGKFNKKKGSMKDIRIYDDNVYIKGSEWGGEYGRGVYARRDIKKGEYFEEVEFVMDKDQKLTGLIKDYTFNLQSRKVIAIAFNCGSMYNHTDKPNCKYFLDEDIEKIVFMALRDISKDEEITVSYGENWWSLRGKEFKKK